jgi:hypothetical protein
MTAETFEGLDTGSAWLKRLRLEAVPTSDCPLRDSPAREGRTAQPDAGVLRPPRLPPAGDGRLIGREMDFECRCGRRCG